MSILINSPQSGPMTQPLTLQTQAPDGNLLVMRLITLAVTMALFGLLAGGFHFWDGYHSIISPAFSYTLLFSLVPLTAVAVLLWKTKRSFPLKEFQFCPFTSSFGLLLVFFTDWMTRGFNLFQGPMIRGELLVIFLILLLFFKLLSRAAINIGAACACITLFALFIFLSNGHPILSDDHASFIFRLTLLKEHFPNIPLYHPWWNAGLDARDFFATGSLAFFFLTLPLHYLFSITESYNFSVGLVLFVILPLSLAYACRLCRISSPGPAIAALLGLASSLVWYRWGLKYGTMGFVTSASLMPMVFALGCRLVNGEQLTKIQLFLFIAAGSLSCMWPLGGVCYIGLVLIAFFRFKSIIHNRQILIAGIFLILINLPWAALFWKVSQVGNFISTSQKADLSTAKEAASTEPAFRHKASGIDLKKGLKAIREQANGTNPLILFLFLPGLTLLSREFRRPFVLQAILLAAGGSLLVSIKPQLELDRLLVFLSLLLIIPTARALVSIFENSQKTIILSSLSFSFLFLSPWITSSILHNRSAEVYHFGDDLPGKLSSALEQHLTTGRAVFSGFVLHELDDGHLAPLATWSRKPLVASSPFHNRWKYTSVFPPGFVARGETGVTEFLDLMNAELVIAHEAHWRNYFSKLPEQYELVWQGYPFLMFKRKNFHSNYFVSGSGEILEQRSDSVRFRLDGPDAVIKFNYFPFLKASSCSLSPFNAGLEQPLIQLTNCPPDREIELNSINPLERLLQ